MVQATKVPRSARWGQCSTASGLCTTPDKPLVHGGFHKVMRLPLRQQLAGALKFLPVPGAARSSTELGVEQLGSCRKGRFPWDSRPCQRS